MSMTEEMLRSAMNNHEGYVAEAFKIRRSRKIDDYEDLVSNMKAHLLQASTEFANEMRNDWIKRGIRPLEAKGDVNAKGGSHDWCHFVAKCWTIRCLRRA
jgi:hypothetical protein